MSSIRIIIDISSESDDYENSIREAMKGILEWNHMWRGENNSESYEFRVEQIM